MSNVIQKTSLTADRFTADVDRAALPKWRTLPVVFVLLVNLPMIASVANWNITPLAELIHPVYVAPAAQRPASISDVPRFVVDAKTHFNKTHGLRGDLMRGHSVVKQSVFASSPQDRLMVGTDGWLFLKADGSLENYRRLNPYSDDELDAQVDEIQYRVKFCRENDCEYRLVIPADKLSVYSEFMHDRFRIANGPARIDQLADALRRRGLGRILVDLRADLLAAKSQGTLYHKTDTHWNRLGAYVGYQAIARSLAGVGFYEPMPLTELQIGRRDALTGGDLARMAGLRLNCDDQIVDVSRPGLHAVNFTGPVDFFARDAEFFAQPNRESTCSAGEFRRGLVLHDSFGSPLLEYLAAHFQTMRSERTTRFTEAAVRRTHPDVLIHVLVERALQRRNPGTP